MIKLIEKVLSKSFKQMASMSVWSPFLLVALSKFFWMVILFYSVQWPLKIIAGPLIARFFSPAALHYPGHLFWMDRILSSTGVFFDVLVGALATLFLIKIIFRRSNIVENDAPKKDSRMFFIFLVLSFLAQVILSLVSKGAVFGVGLLAGKIGIKSAVINMGLLIGTNLLISAIIYALISYIFPAIYELKSFVRGIKLGAKMGASLFFLTFLILLFALACFLPFILVKLPGAKVFLVSSYGPEALLAIDVVSWLWAVVVNTAINVIVINIYIEERGKYEAR